MYSVILWALLCLLPAVVAFVQGHVHKWYILLFSTLIGGLIYWSAWFLLLWGVALLWSLQRDPTSRWGGLYAVVYMASVIAGAIIGFQVGFWIVDLLLTPEGPMSFPGIEALLSGSIGGGVGAGLAWWTARQIVTRYLKAVDVSLK